ncbi:kinase [Nanoarchaeota archaeon]|nr:MAG: kinase [Nanoarchaeota archaeon]
MIAITGTPGVGKTMVAKILSRKLGKKLLTIDDVGVVIGYDKKRKVKIIDERKLRVKGDVIFESHLSHFAKPDVCFVLRCDPKVLARRLKKRGYNPEKIKENVEAEAMGMITSEATSLCKKVHEIDTTNKKPAEVVNEIINVLKTKKYKVGIDYTNYL